jgi:hypothetical protein
VNASQLLGVPLLSLLAAYEQHEPHAVSSHRRRDTLGLPCEVIRPGQRNEELPAIEMEGSSIEDVLALDNVGNERQPEAQSEHGQQDLQRQSSTSRGKKGFHLYLKRAFPVRYLPGATDGSMPVGSDRVFMHFSSNYRSFVLLHRHLLAGLALGPLGAHSRSSEMHCYFLLCILTQQSSTGRSRTHSYRHDWTRGMGIKPDYTCPIYLDSLELQHRTSGKVTKLFAEAPYGPPERKAGRTVAAKRLSEVRSGK